jgi:DNA mismatch endonuclease (patch repair protein)
MLKNHSIRNKEAQRHYLMSRIKGTDTSIEIMLRKALWHEGIRYRKNYKTLPGKPDIVLTRYKIAIFCDGEFWHGKELIVNKRIPKKNQDFWINKIEKNIKRDNEIDIQLFQQGWLVLRFWGNEIINSLSSCVWEIRENIFKIQMDNDDGYHLTTF